MASSADGYGGGEDQFMFHVPQQSRREKLRYPQDQEPPTFHHHHHAANPTPQFHHTTAPPSYLSPSSSSQNPNDYSSFCTTTPPPPLMSLFAHQISHNNQAHLPFSLSLSSSSSSHAPPPSLPSPPPPPPPPRQQLNDGLHMAHPAPLGPFTGYSEILSRSRFLEPARQLLEEVCSLGGVVRWSDGPGEPPAEGRVVPAGVAAAAAAVGEEEGQQQWKKTKLISMLDEVYRRYKLYYQQVQAVITSFESVPGLGSASPYASMALKVMSKHFRCLKNAISDQLHHMNKGIGKERFSEEENISTTGFGILNSGMSPHRPENNYGTVRQPQVWRPQRGLPERAVAVLRAWLFEHFLHPYPTDTDKQMLAKQTGLTRNQVSNWFINARVRLWKPMVEEIHSLEMRQQHKSGDMNPNITDKQTQLASSSTPSSSNNPPFQNDNQNNPNQSSKQPQNELSQIPNHIQDHNYLVYDAFHGHHNVGLLGGSGGGVDIKGNGGGVSLTLGLHQNNGICMTEPIPLNVVRRFGLGLDECNEAYVIGSYEGQDRHFEKDIGGQLLHDFVG